jgi:hypothetical protein
MNLTKGKRRVPQYFENIRNTYNSFNHTSGKRHSQFTSAREDTTYAGSRSSHSFYITIGDCLIGRACGQGRVDRADHLVPYGYGSFTDMGTDTKTSSVRVCHRRFVPSARAAVSHMKGPVCMEEIVDK